MSPSLTPALLLALLLGTAAALTPTTAGAQNARERTLFVSAVDDQGEPVDGLGPDAFVIRENGQRREVLRVSRAIEPIDIALLVDNSAAAAAEITFIREALTKFVAAMAADHRIAIIALADRPTLFVDYTSDAARLSEGVSRVFAMAGSGMTLLDGVSETARGLEKRDGPRAVIIPVVTDGVEFTNLDSRSVVRSLRSAGAALHAVLMGRFEHSNEHAVRERSFFIDEGPRATGGQRITLLAPNALPKSMERLARELSAQYKVVYGRPDSLYLTDEFEITSARPGVTMRGTAARGETGAVK